MALAAQDSFKVNYKGDKPNIIDFAWAYLNYLESNQDECGDHPENGVRDALDRYCKGLPFDEYRTITVDKKNGYILYEFKYESTVHRIEMCYWNEADGKHKLFAFCNMNTIDYETNQLIVTETHGMDFYRYNNATHKMTDCNPPGFNIEYDCAYELPRTGKNITVTKWNANGTKTKRTLKWNGHRFSF